MANRTVLVIVGSLRKDSLNRRTAQACVEVSPPGLTLSFAEIGQLPLYNQDLDDSPPREWVAFRDAVRPADGILFATPEYNRSVPGVLKNAIDVGSRPYGKSVWAGKPAAVLSVSVGAIGGFGANHHLRQSLVFLGMPAMPQPEIYIGGAEKLFEGPKLANEGTRELLRMFMNAFAQWIERNA